MGSSSWDIERQRPPGPPAMTMSSTPTSGNSLPPLQQVGSPSAPPPLSRTAQINSSVPAALKAIPEFHSHNPQERRSSSVPRKLADRGSPSFRPPHRVSPGSSSAVSDAGSMRCPRNPPGPPATPRFLLTGSAWRGGSYPWRARGRRVRCPAVPVSRPTRFAANK